MLRVTSPFYRQEVLFDSRGIKSAECSCPVGDGGHCKHTVALLLTWVNDPNSFQEVEEIDAILEKLSKEAERFINYRDRGNYSQATLCLREIRNIYRHLNEIQSWDKLIAEIRERFRKLPRFQMICGKLGARSK